jgi:hypothetical protein
MAHWYRCPLPNEARSARDRLRDRRRERSMAIGAEAPSLLSGLIFDSDGARLTPTHAVIRHARRCGHGRAERARFAERSYPVN